MKLKVQGKKSKKVENKKNMAGKDKTGNIQVHKEAEVRKEAAAPPPAGRELLTKI